MKRVSPRSNGFTLAEVVLGGTVLAVAIAAILGAYVGQVTLNEHARNLSLAIQDANRVIEQIRQDTASCTAPDVNAPLLAGVVDGNDWNGWMNAVGKSIQPNPQNNEFVQVTCQSNAGGNPPPTPCATPAGGTDPIRVTVAVCWRHRGRIIGECLDTPTLTPGGDADGSGPHNIAGVVESPAMLTTLVTCRG